MTAWSRDSKLKLVLLSLTGIAGGAIACTSGLQFPSGDLIAPLAIVGTLGPCAAFYQKRNGEQFVMSLAAVLHVLLFTACFTVLMYATATTNAPLIDDTLMQADAAIGVHVPDIVGWMNDRPLLAETISYAYLSVMPQTLIVVLLLGFQSERRPLEQFVLRFMIALLITAAVFSIAPARGPFATYGYEPNPTQQSYLEHLDGLRSGERTVVSLRDAEGLVTFPSFHTAWAILLAAAFWHRKKLFVPFALLNAVVILGTMTTGWHYATDVLGGIAVAAITIALTNRLRPWLARPVRVARPDQQEGRAPTA